MVPAVIRGQGRNSISCELFSYSNAPHLQQVYAGFHILNRAGIVNLTQRIHKDSALGSAQLKVILNGKHVLYYDTHDSFKINANILKDADFYFKRSYLQDEVVKHNGVNRVFPLGLNYLVYTSGCDRFLAKRIALQQGFEKLRSLIIAFNLDRCLGRMLYVPRVDKLSQYPEFKSPPKALFMVRAFDPKNRVSDERRDEVDKLDCTRAECIRLLRKEFGTWFVGGFMHDDYSVKRFKDCLISDNRLTQKGNYLNLLREYSICIATTGLHGSIGWKLGEYVAHSKAIVTEPLNYEVPGQFCKESNYLEFLNPNECVAAVGRLIQDRALRSDLMVNNFKYYHTYVRPDAMVFNTLLQAMRA